MRILTWHVHAAWSSAFVRGEHEYVVPVLPDRSPYGRGRPRTYAWPESVIEVAPEDLATIDIDLVVLQRPEEEELAHRWTGRRLPAVYVEHNTPRGDVPNARHPLADRDDITIVHVTHFNDLFWDCGATRTTVIEHGIPDPGHRWSGEVPHLAVVTNEPVRRARITGTDLIGQFTDVAPVDVFGMGLDGLARSIGLHHGPAAAIGDLRHAELLAAVAARRAYLHLTRWTSLGLSLLEAMTMGCPVVALATTDAVTAVPPDAGVLSTRIADLIDGCRYYLYDFDAAARAGAAGRAWALSRYGLPRFLDEWDHLLGSLIPYQRPSRSALTIGAQG